MKKTRLVILLPAILTVLLLGSASLPAQTSRIEIGYSAISGDALPAWVAKEAGLEVPLSQVADLALLRQVLKEAPLSQ